MRITKSVLKKVGVGLLWFLIGLAAAILVYQPKQTSQVEKTHSDLSSTTQI